MPRRPHLTVIAVVLALTGCSGDVEVAVPQVSGTLQQGCTALVAALPNTVDGQERRDTTPPSGLTAAWGDPPILLTCGVATPPIASDGAPCYEVNGVGWYADEQPGNDTVVFTTVGRAFNVEVTVGSEHAPQADALVDLAAPIKQHNRQLKPCR